MEPRGTSRCLRSRSRARYPLAGELLCPGKHCPSFAHSWPTAGDGRARRGWWRHVPAVSCGGQRSADRASDTLRDCCHARCDDRGLARTPLRGCDGASHAAAPASRRLERQPSSAERDRRHARDQHWAWPTRPARTASRRRAATFPARSRRGHYRQSSPPALWRSCCISAP